MQLFYQTHSPYARKILVLIDELGLREKTLVTHYETSPTNRNNQVFELNPLGKVPILVHAGVTLYDSAVISRYLMDRFSTDSDCSLPNFQDLQHEALATGIADAGILARWEIERRPLDKRYQPFLDGQLLKLTESYDYLEKISSEGHSVARSLGNIALATALEWVEFVKLPSFRLGRPSLSNWLDRVTDSESFRTTPYSGNTSDSA